MQKCLDVDPLLNLRLILSDDLGDVSAEPSVLSSSLKEFGYSRQAIDAVSSAFLANAFVDQLPVSIPNLTGNQAPRILGSLTPGSLVNFRNFVLEASKVSPSIMKLRDAV